MATQKFALYEVGKITGEYEAMLKLIVELMEQTLQDLLNLM
jgi:hypothetical protein